MRTIKTLFICACCMIAFQLSAQDYTAFSETFGTPSTPIGQTTYDVPLAPATPATISGVSNFIPYPGSTSSYGVPATNSTWFYNGTNNYYGIINSASLFGGTTTGYTGVGTGFLAYTWTNKGATSTGFDTFWRTIIPGDRFVKGSNYTLSGYVAGDAGANWNPAVESPRGVLNFSLLPVIYFAVANLSGTDPTVKVNFGNVNSITSLGTPAPSTSIKDTTAVTNGAGWTPFSIRTDRYNTSPTGVIGDVAFDLRCSHSKSTVILIDEVQINGPRPTITAQQNSTNSTAISLSATSSSPALSPALAVSSNHAGITPITATITGPGAAYFTLCDQTGAPRATTYAIAGDNIYVKYSPDASVTATQTATLTLNASSNPAYGASPVAITLTGNLGLSTDIKTSEFKNSIVLKNNVVANFLSATVLFSKQVNWTIFNQSGKQVALYPGSGKLDVNVSDLSTGIYIIKATNVSSGEVLISKFIKK